LPATALRPTRPQAWRRSFVGLDERVPVAGGGLVRYVNLDNAATTPAHRSVADAVGRCLRTYASVHRGAGYKARVSTAAYDEAHTEIARFVGADLRTNVVIFGRNTTEALNKLANRLPMPADAVVVTTMMEHHSNDLPWRRRARVVRVRVTPDGRLDEDDVDRTLARYAGRIAIVAVSGASNVTGFVQPVHRLARKAHAVGAPIVVDAAQLVAHRPLDVRADSDPEHLDFVAFSGHKMYAPFGAGVLVGPRDVFLRSAPDSVGGGTVDTVTENAIVWAGLPDREEAGTPNAVGAVAMAAAARQLDAWTLSAVEGHERALAEYTRARLRTVPGLTLYGDAAGDDVDRVGVISFNLASADHALVAAVLGYEGGIGVRNGCFCAQPYVAHLLGVDMATAASSSAGDGRLRPGMVRISLGIYNTTADIDAAVDLLAAIAAGRHGAAYERVSPTEYGPGPGKSGPPERSAGTAERRTPGRPWAATGTGGRPSG
jgi:selenocysteine lyase/cysteine desulfurase